MLRIFNQPIFNFALIGMSFFASFLSLKINKFVLQILKEKNELMAMIITWFRLQIDQKNWKLTL